MRGGLDGAGLRRLHGGRGGRYNKHSSLTFVFSLDMRHFVLCVGKPHQPHSNPHTQCGAVAKGSTCSQTSFAPTKRADGWCEVQSKEVVDLLHGRCVCMWMYVEVHGVYTCVGMYGEVRAGIYTCMWMHAGLERGRGSLPAQTPTYTTTHKSAFVQMKFDQEEEGSDFSFHFIKKVRCVCVCVRVEVSFCTFHVQGPPLPPHAEKGVCLRLLVTYHNHYYETPQHDDTGVYVPIFRCQSDKTTVNVSRAPPGCRTTV